MRMIEVDLIGDGTKDNPYRPNLSPEYRRYIDDSKTLASVDTKSRRIRVYFTKDVPDWEIQNTEE